MDMSSYGEVEIARLRKSLSSENRHERAQAVLEAGQCNTETMLMELSQVLNDPDDLVAIAAMTACWWLGEKQTPIDRAVNALATQDEEVVMAAVHALGEMGETQVPKLVELLDRNSSTAHQIVQILGDIGGDSSLLAVRKAANSPDIDLAAAARRVLEEWED